MLPQSIVDTVIVLGMFLFRIGLPVAILLALGYWFQKKMEPKAVKKPEQPEARGNIIPFRETRQPNTPPSSEIPAESRQRKL